MSLRRYAVLAVVGLSACAPSNPSIQIETAVFPDTMCQVQVTNPRLFHGLYDANLGGGYAEAVVYRSRLVTRARAPGAPVGEPDDFTVTGAIISLEDIDGVALPIPTARYRVAASAFIPAGTDTMPSQGVGTIEIIPQALAADIAAITPVGIPRDIVARVTAFGETSGGNHIDMNDWIFPVEICNGCLCNTVPPMTSCHPGADGEGYAGIVPCP